MSDNNESYFQNSMRKITNVILTKDGDTDFKYSSAENDVNAEVKNGIKKKKVHLVFLAIWFFILILIFAVENILLLMGVLKNYFILGITPIISFLFLAPFLWNWYVASKRTKELYDNTIVIKAVEESIPGAKCDPTGYIDAVKLHAVGAIPQYDSVQGSYLISYSKNGKMCYISNLKLTESVFDSKLDRYDSKTYFIGQAYILSFRSNLQGNVRIFTKKRRGVQYYHGDKKNEHRVHIENQRFEDVFEVYATNEQDAFYVLTPYVMEQLLMLEKQYGHFGVGIVGDQIAIALNTGYYLFAMPREYKEIDKMSIENSKKRMQQIMAFAQKLEDSINSNR